jgi:formylglycine-generating enzyme required for sulfatase activity
MRKLVSVASAIVVIVLLGLIVGGAGAQSPTPAPPTATPLVVTATPMPQVIVVTATPQPGPPSSWWEENWRTILLGIVTGLVGLILGGVFKPTFERIGQWLARVLSSLGAGRNFRRWYLDYLVDEYRCLNIRGLRTRAPVAVELEQVYVSLRAEVPGAELESAAARRTFTIGQVMDRHQRLAIVGGPGCGKTTLLAYLTLTYARDKTTLPAYLTLTYACYQVEERLGLKEKRLPILVPLRLLKTVLAPTDDKAPTTLPEYLDACYEELGRKPPPGFFDRRLRAGECLVLLDGLDEVADEQERRQMAEWVDNLVATYPHNRYIVTSRPAGYDSAPLENDFTRYEVRDFEMPEVEQFVRNWYLAVETATQGDTPKARRDAAQRARELSAAIRVSVGIRRLVVNPLLLSIVALVHRYRAHLPDRRVDLYNECVDVLLEHWEAAKGLVGPSTLLRAGALLPAQKRAVLQSLALAMHKVEVHQVPRSEVEQLIAAYLPQVSGGQAKSADVALFLNEVRERSGLLVEQEMDTYAFSHLTFHEYLAASEIAGSEDEAERTSLVDHATSEWWREVLLLYAGMRERDPSPVVQALLERDRAGQEAGEPDRAYLLLAGECLAEAVKVQPDVRHEVERELEGLFTAQVEPRAFLRAGRVLVRLKEDEGLEHFLQLMDTGEEQIRTAAALALGQMGREADSVLLGRIVRALLSRMDKGEEWIRTAVTLALGEMWREADPTLLERLLRDLVALAPEKNLWREVGLVLQEVDNRLLEILADPDAPHTLQDAAAAALDRLLIEVPAGEFIMGSEEYNSEKPLHKVHLDKFYVARYPVTNAQWARFVAATGRKPPRHWPDGACPADKATRPVVYVNWYDAKVYAEWVGLQLLSEAQWEKAARGGLQIPNPKSPTSNLQPLTSLVDNPNPRRRYPWGDQFDRGKCNTYESGLGRTTPVGLYSPDGDSPYGVADMTGNVWEWTSSLYRKYPYRTDEEREDARASGRWVLRGGSFRYLERLARCSGRGHLGPSHRWHYHGFRVGWYAAPGLSSDSGS